MRECGLGCEFRRDEDIVDFAAAFAANGAFRVDPETSVARALDNVQVVSTGLSNGRLGPQYLLDCVRIEYGFHHVLDAEAVGQAFPAQLCQ